MIRLGLGVPLALLLLASGCLKDQTSPRRSTHLHADGGFDYRHYDAPSRDDDGNWSGGGLPIAIAIDARGDAWVLGEFHSAIQRVSASGSLRSAEQIPIPQHATALPFVDRHGLPTRTSMLGEGLVIGARSVVWLTQGGGYLAEKGTNHSRVVSYDPGSSAFRAYNLPGNQNEAMGLLWDEGRGLVWVAESGAGSLLAFDPDLTPFDNTFAWDRSLDSLLCSGPTLEPRGCFARFHLPEQARTPAQLTRDDTGAIWFTLFWGSAVGRLDPETGDVTVYELSKGLGEDARSSAVGPGPWDIDISPDGKYVVWSEFFDATVARLPLERADDEACRKRMGDENPCVEEVRVSTAAPGLQQVHSIAFDRFGNLWFTQFTFPVSPGVSNSVGFVTSDWSKTVVLDPRVLHPDGAGSYAGIAIDAESGDIWIAEFLPPGIGRITPASRNHDPARW